MHEFVHAEAYTGLLTGISLDMIPWNGLFHTNLFYKEQEENYKHFKKWLRKHKKKVENMFK